MEERESEATFVHSFLSIRELLWRFIFVHTSSVRRSEDHARFEPGPQALLEE